MADHQDQVTTPAEPPAPAARPAGAQGMFPAGHLGAGTGEPPEQPMPPGGPTLVATPGGYRQPENVHLVDPSQALEGGAGRLRHLDHDGTVIAEFAAPTARSAGRSARPRDVLRRAATALAGGIHGPELVDGWIVDAEWDNTTGHPTTRFATTWVVPSPPATDNGQLIYLFNGIVNSAMILQPVLQWGYSPAGGGSSWAVASWYVNGIDGAAFHSPLTPVSVGQTLVGVMTLTAQAGDQFSYECEFTGIANSKLTVSKVEELTAHYQTLEAYQLQAASDYPLAEFTAFSAIDIQTAAGRPATTWTPSVYTSDVGQAVRVVSSANPNGEVDLYYTAPVAATAATAVVNLDGRMEVLLRRTDGAIFDLWQTAPHSGPWSRTTGRGGAVAGPVAAAANTDGRLEIIAIGVDHAVWHAAQTAAGGPNWTGWSSLGGWGSQVVVARNGAGSLQAFAIGASGALYTCAQATPGSSNWTAWTGLGGWIKDLAVTANSDGRLEVFGIGADNGLYHIAQTQVGAGSWTGWMRLGGWISAVAAIGNSDGRIEVLGIGGDQALYNIAQTLPHSGPWSSWHRLGGAVTALSPILNTDGRLQVMAIGTDRAVWEVAQSQPHSGPWTTWNRVGGTVSQISAAVNSNGRVEVFGVGLDRDVYHAAQTAPHSATWTRWAKLT